MSGLVEIPLRSMSEAREAHGDILALTRHGRWVVVGKDDGFKAFYVRIDGRLAYEAPQDYAELFTFREDELQGWIALPEAGNAVHRHLQSATGL